MSLTLLIDLCAGQERRLQHSHTDRVKGKYISVDDSQKVGRRERKFVDN